MKGGETYHSSCCTFHSETTSVDATGYKSHTTSVLSSVQGASQSYNEQGLPPSDHYQVLLQCKCVGKKYKLARRIIREKKKTSYIPTHKNTHNIYTCTNKNRTPDA